jgi:hypothetical protein
MTVKTELQHMGEFLVGEMDGTISREKGTLASGQIVTDGTVLQLVSGKLHAATGANGEVVKGIAYGSHDASAGDITIPYIARLAEVDQSLVIAEGSGSTVDWTQLEALFIIPR